jgi:hypothetical protein
VCRSSAPQKRQGPPVAPSLDASLPLEVALKPLRVVLERGGTETTMPPLFVIRWSQCHRTG